MCSALDRDFKAVNQPVTQGALLTSENLDSFKLCVPWYFGLFHDYTEFSVSGLLVHSNKGCLTICGCFLGALQCDDDGIPASRQEFERRKPALRRQFLRTLKVGVASVATIMVLHYLTPTVAVLISLKSADAVIIVLAPFLSSRTSSYASLDILRGRTYHL
jgi:hypothetical protein